MALKWVPTSNGKGWVQVGRRNAEEWLELMKTASGVQRITSVNQRAADHQAHQKEQDDKDPKRQGRRD